MNSSYLNYAEAFTVLQRALEDVIMMNRRLSLAVLALGTVLLAAPYLGTAYATSPALVLFGAPFGAFEVVIPPEYRQNGPN